jgi:hypothetical protein
MRWTCSIAWANLQNGVRDQHLPLFLERAHAVAPRLRGAADEDHRPAVLLRVGEAGEAWTTPGPTPRGRRRAAGQVADGLRGIRGDCSLRIPT